MANIETYHIPKESTLTITPDANASGHVVRVYSGSQPTNFQAISASTPIVLGPYNDERDYRVTLLGGTVTTEVAFAGTEASDVSQLQTDLAALETQLTAVAFQADLANDADGTAIAAAVNGLRDTLVALGLMEADV